MTPSSLPRCRRCSRRPAGRRGAPAENLRVHWRRRRGLTSTGSPTRSRQGHGMSDVHERVELLGAVEAVHRVTHSTHSWCSPADTACCTISSAWPPSVLSHSQIHMPFAVSAATCEVHGAGAFTGGRDVTRTAGATVAARRERRVRGHGAAGECDLARSHRHRRGGRALCRCARRPRGRCKRVPSRNARGRRDGDTSDALEALEGVEPDVGERCHSGHRSAAEQNRRNGP